MFSNEQVLEEIAKLMKDSQNYINSIEAECCSKEPNVGIISISNGKLSKCYELIANYLGIYDKAPKYLGSWRESSRTVREGQNYEDAD